MQLFKTPASLQTFSTQCRKNGKRIALVPTMGNLHDGHLSLITEACRHAKVVIVSIFVNPTQFGPHEDYEKYPRTLDDDMAKIASATTCETVVYHPDPQTMYAPDHSVWVTEDSLSAPLCGMSRPIHFRGVTTVVAKLFHAALPDVAVFGQKDAQQAMIIRRMIRDLDFPIQMIIAPIVREADGLAMSSRNRYLSKEERANAPALYRALKEAKVGIQSGKYTITGKVKDFLRDAFKCAGGRPDYIETVDAETLQPAVDFTKPVLIAVAVYFGQTRLIDNIEI